MTKQKVRYTKEEIKERWGSFLKTLPLTLALVYLTDTESICMRGVVPAESVYEDPVEHNRILLEVIRELIVEYREKADKEVSNG